MRCSSKRGLSASTRRMREPHMVHAVLRRSAEKAKGLRRFLARLLSPFIERRAQRAPVALFGLATLLATGPALAMFLEHYGVYVRFVVCHLGALIASASSDVRQTAFYRHRQRERNMRFVRHLRTALVLGGLICSGSAFAGSYYQAGHITSMTTIVGGSSSNAGVLISLDSGLPDNCSGTLFGWMWIPAGSTTAAYVLGLWLEGGESTVTVTVYTSGIASNQYCAVTQIQPSN